MTASEKLRALREPALAYIERKELGNENIIAANTFVDALVDASAELLAVVEAAESLGTADYLSRSVIRDVTIPTALAALDEALGAD